MRLNEEEAGAAANFLGLGPEDFRRLYLEQGQPPWDIRTGPDNFCLFHQADGRCLIHPVKPAVCRAWPFLPGILRHESAFEEAKLACPGLAAESDWAGFRKAWREREGAESA